MNINESAVADTAHAKGSLWHRWDPHIHAPGTILNDQFTGPDAWEDYLTRIESSSPTVRALGITDYYSVETYKEVIKHKKSGRLSSVALVFPNVELRLGLGTSRDAAINLHLLVSPDDPNHVSEIERFLNKLTFSIGSETFHCNRGDLIKLGFHHDKVNTDQTKALEIGTNQFKVQFDQIIKEIKASEWAQQNILLAVAGSSTDGTSGLANDSSFNEQRVFIEKSCHCVFSGQDKQRLFWLGQGPATIERIKEKWNGPKPCIHGSDAHELVKVAVPEMNRYTWIKGDLVFESLRQICLEPEDRVSVGELPPVQTIDSATIDAVTIDNASWLVNPIIPVNAGLVTIIGSRGSGKTALADCIAVAGGAAGQVSPTSFIARASDHLGGAGVNIRWLSGEEERKFILNSYQSGSEQQPRVQYLSQQFVEQLCSAEGVTDELMNEIERVIFTAHPPEHRLGFSDFRGMLDESAAAARREKAAQQETIAELIDQSTKERLLISGIESLKKQRDEKAKSIETDKKGREKLMPTSKDAKLEQLRTVTNELDARSKQLEAAKRNLAALEGLQQYVDNAKNIRFPTFLEKLKADNKHATLAEKEWQSFSIAFTGDVDTLLSTKIIAAKQEVETIKGKAVVIDPNKFSTTSFIIDGAPLADQAYEVLNAEVQRLTHFVGIDTQNGKQITRLSEKITREEKELAVLAHEIAHAEGGRERVKGILAKRSEAYVKVFEQIIEEEKILRHLYAPLQAALQQQKGSLGKLTFYVKREADVESWAEAGENLMDLRKTGPFRGKGTLLQAIKETLKPSWENGNATDVGIAMQEFREKHEQTLRDAFPHDDKDKDAIRNYLNELAKWLYDTSHITISYGVKYDGVDIQQLSPGTRGIVLLLMYLAIDKEDIRPLVIDQPEENLDPKSIYDELVPLFRQAKKRRQIIIVTHNANLVINADSDQVIVASAGPHKPGHLPNIAYQTGGLENIEIRKEVCRILEGGEEAFRDRARRLRLNLK